MSAKSILRSGKHLDKFFDDLIQDIILLHNKMKEEYRADVEDQIANEFEAYERNQLKSDLQKFNRLNDELLEFKKTQRLAEIQLNQECYETTLMKMEEHLYNHEIYANLLRKKA